MSRRETKVLFYNNQEHCQVRCNLRSEGDSVKGTSGGVIEFVVTVKVNLRRTIESDQSGERRLTGYILSSVMKQDK